MKIIIDVYDGAGTPANPDTEITVRDTRAAIRAARKEAERKWGKVERCYPADDDIASFGLVDDDRYVTARHWSWSPKIEETDEY